MGFATVMVSGDRGSVFCAETSSAHNSGMDAITRLARARSLPRAAVLLALLFTAAAAQPVREPAPGVLLVADERMMDPRFNRAVVLLIEHDRTGSWGLIINKPTGVGVAQVAPSIELSGEGPVVYFGGPVQVEQLRLLYRDGGAPHEDNAGLPGVGWSDSGEELRKRLTEDSGPVRVYAGYAGWAPGQLDFEVAHGGWRMIQGRPGNVFSDEPEALWQRLSKALDGIAI